MDEFFQTHANRRASLRRRALETSRQNEHCRLKSRLRFATDASRTGRCSVARVLLNPLESARRTTVTIVARHRSTFVGRIGVPTRRRQRHLLLFRLVDVVAASTSCRRSQCLGDARLDARVHGCRTSGALLLLLLRAVVEPLVLRATTCVHKEVAHGGDVESELLCNCQLHLLGGPLGLLEDRLQCASLEVGEDEARLLAGRLLRWLCVGGLHGGCVVVVVGGVAAYWRDGLLLLLLLVVVVMMMV